MELWIRSQDNTVLCKAINLCIRENKNENNETNFVIQDVYTLGYYSSKERAIEVLNEIANYISNINDKEDGNEYYPIFKMPNE